MSESLDPITHAVRSGIAEDPAHGAVVPPLYLSSNFTFAAFGTPRTYDYSRSGNPTRAELERALAGLEGGAGCTCTGSGMAAVTLAVHAFLLSQTGAGGRPPRVLAQHDIYGGTHRLLSSLATSGQLEVAWADLSEAGAQARILEFHPDLVWVETPSNPLLRVIDVGAVVSAAQRTGARVLVDNTFLSPALQSPLELGADLVLHSTTKSINGHSDAVAGALIARAPDDAEQAAWWANALGLGQAPFDAYLVLRGLRTLHARWAVHERNAGLIAERLVAHPQVAKVHYPGLVNHPGHAVARAQQRGFGGIVSLELAGGEGAARAFVERLRLFSLAESLGGVESLVAHPATMTHASMDPDARRRAGIGEGLLRLSVGIEAVVDLVSDLLSALDGLRRAA